MPPYKKINLQYQFMLTSYELLNHVALKFE